MISAVAVNTSNTACVQQHVGSARAAAAARRQPRCSRPEGAVLPPRQGPSHSHRARRGGLCRIPRTLLLVVIRQLCNVRTTLGTLSENAQIQIMEADLDLVPLTTARRAV